MHTFGVAKNNNLDYVSFTAKKYGQNSNILKLAGMEPGEYGVMVSNPNNRDEKQTVVSTFSAI